VAKARPSDSIRAQGRPPRRRGGAARLADAIDALPDGFVLYDRDDRLVACNRRYRELYDYPPPEVDIVGMSYESIVRAGVEAGLFAPAITNSDPGAFIAALVTRHREATGVPVEMALANGR